MIDTKPYAKLKYREVKGRQMAYIDAVETVLNKVLAETDKVQRRIAATDTAMEADGIDAATLTVLATRRSKRVFFFVRRATDCLRGS